MYNFPTGLSFLPVTKNTFIYVDLEKEDLLIRSVTNWESGDKINIRIYDETNDDVNIGFVISLDIENEYTYRVAKLLG